MKLTNRPSWCFEFQSFFMVTLIDFYILQNVFFKLFKLLFIFVLFYYQLVKPRGHLLQHASR